MPIPWNKGLVGIYSPETLKKMSLARLGKPAWNKGVARTPEEKLRIGAAIRLAMRGRPGSFSGKHHTKEAKEKLRQAHLGKPSWCKGLTAKTDPRVAAIGQKTFGEKNHRWRGGSRRTMQNYAFRAWENSRGPFPEGMVLHHKDENPRNNRIGNLACITWSEHERIHQRNPNRDLRTKRFLAKEKS